MKNKQPDYKIINGAYFCTKHDAKNCVECFEQPKHSDIWESEKVECQICAKEAGRDTTEDTYCDEHKPEKVEGWDSLQLRKLLNEFLSDVDAQDDIEPELANAIVSAHLKIFELFLRNLLKKEREEIIDKVKILPVGMFDSTPYLEKLLEELKQL